MKEAITVFDNWAEQGKDIGMEKGHAKSVQDMLSFALEERVKIGKKFNFLDFGCGNGWVPRIVRNHHLCSKVVGIDGAAQMISNAISRGGDIEYIHADIATYTPNHKFDLIHSMEVLYYLNDPELIIKQISEEWLAEDGRLIVGIDHYYENKDSHSWEEKLQTPMLMLKESEWLDLFISSGLSEIKSWRSNQAQKWAGTLVLTGKRN
jgi:trans-aconitate methyltransferase